MEVLRAARNSVCYVRVADLRDLEKLYKVGAGNFFIHSFQVLLCNLPYNERYQNSWRIQAMPSWGRRS